MRPVLRERLTRWGERILVGLGGDALARKHNRHRTLILAYHDIVPSGEPAYGDRSLHLPQEAFAEQLDLLGQTHEIVSVASIESNQPPQDHEGRGRPRAAITFDDAYRGALTAGLEELSRRGLPATVFVTPALLGQEAFWWDRLASQANGFVDERLRERALTALGGRQAEILQWAGAEGLLDDRTVPEYARPADLSLLRSAAERPGVTLASHAWSHPSLPDASDEDLDRELKRPMDWFAGQELPFQPWLAFPYGRHSPSVTRRARDVYRLGFTTSRGYAPGRADNLPDRMRVPRANIPAGLSLHRFRLLTSGALDLL